MADRIRERKEALLDHLTARLYGEDARPRRHAPPRADTTEDRPHVSPERLCGNCARWSPFKHGDEHGYCHAGFEAHGAPRYSTPEPYPHTSRGSRCWAYGGKGWQGRKAGGPGPEPDAEP